MIPEGTKFSGTNMSDIQPENFITVVSVGPKQEQNGEDLSASSNIPGYVTVLTIGDTKNNNKVLKDVTEEVIVYRLPGERLGFGLKFEGGTKANEFVERLFIQSCAADSPASHVKSSWGKLTEGDEVLEIDSIPVKTMTRVDCVRCLKDSNVAIKLLVRHVFEDLSSKSKEEPPSVINAEEKRTPPPPPPVPPRKIPRKMIKNPNSNPPSVTNGIKEPQENSRDNVRPPDIVPSSTKSKKLQSPRSSGRYYSPDVPRRDRRFSDGSLGPPDAEVYVDLFLQESTQSLSESDDTGSTISTVIDRFGSFPTTTTSSFSGSLPSTPTAMQRHLDISNVNIYDDEDISINNKNNEKSVAPNREENNNIISDGGSPLCFQDAPLSYGNESTKMIVPEEMEETSVVANENKQSLKKPPVPPRSKDLTVSLEKHKDKTSENLPRLVDFVPKSNGVKENGENSTEIIKLFLENERHRINCDDFESTQNDNTDNVDTYSNNLDIYTSKWNMSSLATIGEVEEETSGTEFNNFNRSATKSTPVVIVENADISDEGEKCPEQYEEVDSKKLLESDEAMATPPSDSRQPPDGDEFPDFVETSNRNGSQTINSPSNSYFKPSEPDSLISVEDLSKPASINLSQASSSNDLSNNMYESAEDLKHTEIPQPSPLHTRSQSLIDMSALSKEKNARWHQIVEQRRKGLSKLKGLVIPEATENDVAPQPINIPEIKSINTAVLFSVPKIDNSFSVPQLYPPPETKSPIIVPPLVSNTTSNLPKYSPAFKRKSLQVYPTSVSRNENNDNGSTAEIIKICDKSSSPRSSKVSDDDLNPPKSLESIASPTRSDCSFDYASFAKKSNKENNESLPKTHHSRLEDESDNDSAVSSSQSSYNSRFSPPPSPTRSCEIDPFKSKDEDDKNSQNRLLKASSVEAINRKNVLASAKCRSGKDLKLGSPLIRRKDENKEAERPPTNGESNPEKGTVDEVKNESSVWEKVNATTIPPKDIKNIPVEPSKNEEPLRSPTRIIETAPTPPTVLPRSTSVPNCLPLTTTTPTRITRSPSENKEQRHSILTTPSHRPYTGVLNRKSTPINVKALTQNFEKFGSSTPPLPQKVPAYKSQVITKNVKAEILKTENKILNNGDSGIKRVSKPEVKPKPKQLVQSLKLEKTDDDSETNRLLSTETVVLRLETLGSSLGITISGGVDENKEITIHRIRYGSIAYHDGRLKRGDKVISINGKSLKGLSHTEAGDLLKEPVMEFTLEIQEGIEMVPSTPSSLSSRRSSSLSVLTEVKSPTVEAPSKEANQVISFVKDGSGLGFSIEGGKESPQGDVPLIVKKIFTGGAADKHGELKIADEILQMNDISFLNLTRIEAWNMMKKIPDGMVNIHVYRKC